MRGCGGGVGMAGAARATLIMQGLAEHSQGQTRPHGCVRLGAGVDAAAATAAATGLRVPKNPRSLGNSGDCALPTSAPVTPSLPPFAWVMYVRRAACSELLIRFN